MTGPQIECKGPQRSGMGPADHTEFLGPQIYTLTTEYNHYYRNSSVIADLPMGQMVMADGRRSTECISSLLLIFVQLTRYLKKIFNR